MYFVNDNITAVFIVDYLDNLRNALKEAKRVLKKNGKLIIINSKKPISSFYQIQEKKFWKANELKKLLIEVYIIPYCKHLNKKTLRTSAFKTSYVYNL